ncbi:MASE1 domain-containing protein [Streptomyces sp. RB17]|uniref:MASE1 domain-containing protein n=1 Tax=Streptomyces sp. RB17 TaxID=2585197 RepID=UPI002B2159A0|nr:MASE1 domain-containing protein [Streptomyces sp. RB17]
MGVLVVTPVLLVLRSARRPRGAPASRWAEALLLLPATAGYGFLVTGHTPLLFLGFPLLIWAAFRFQLAGAAPCAPAVSICAIIAGTERSGPFAGQDLLTAMITLQAFNGSAALTALMLATVVSERNQTQQEIARACGQLAAMATKIAVVDRLPTLPDAEAGKKAGDQQTRKAVSSSLRRRPATGNNAGRDDRI